MFLIRPPLLAPALLLKPPMDLMDPKCAYETPILDIKTYEEHFDWPVGIKRERHPGYKPDNDIS